MINNLTFSLDYRHVPENNLENLQVLLILNLRIAERKHVRVCVYERDDIKVLVSRLMSYLIQHDAYYLYDIYQDYFAQSIIYLLESKLMDLGYISPLY